MNILHLLECIQKDARSAIKRWSMRELASQHLRFQPSKAQQPPSSRQLYPLSNTENQNHADNDTNTDANVSTELLQCTVQRLAVQYESLREWKEALNHALEATTPNNNNSNDATIVQLYHSAIKRIDTLQYVHYDTYRIGQQILQHPSQILVRQTGPDRHVIHTTFLEIRARHAKTIETIVDIVSDLRRRQQQHPPQQPPASLHFGRSRRISDTTTNNNISILNETMAEQILRRRIGIQLLCDHHVALHKGQLHGGVSVQTRLLQHVLTDAIQEAKHIVDAHLPVVPDVQVMVVAATMVEDNFSSMSPNLNSTQNHPSEIHCTMIQPWVHHAIVELLKNAMSSTVRQMQYTNNTTASIMSTTPTPVFIKCYDTEHSVIIDIIDAGTGIGVDKSPNDDDDDDDDDDHLSMAQPTTDITAIQQAFRLGHTTAASHRYDRLKEQQSYASVQIPPLSSLGVGLPISQYFMEHFHGTLQLWNNNNPPNHHSTGTTITTTISDTTTGCTARIELLKDDTILERFTPL